MVVAGYVIIQSLMINQLEKVAYVYDSHSPANRACGIDTATKDYPYVFMYLEASG